MHFFNVFSVLLALVTSSEMKTNKELERKVGDLQKTVRELERTKKENEKTNKDLEKNVGDLQMTVGELERTNQQIERTVGELERTNKEREKTNKEMENTVGELERTNTKITKTVGELEKKFNLFMKNMEINEAKIKKIENQTEPVQAKAELRSNMCAVWAGRYPASGPITYNKMTLEDNNIAGASFNKDLGVYTAGVSGTYQIDFYASDFITRTSGGLGNCQNQLRIHLNGATCYGCAMGNWCSWTPNTGIVTVTGSIPGGLSHMIHMEADDFINVHAEQICELYNIMLCVSYVKP